MAVSQWLKRGLPLERCWDIEAATGGKVTKADLRPDRFTNQ
jgi:DNA-binding transcriptional regulator YdaS (Cro superfamily)